jgi:adhesin transport system outer membrane protein
MSKRVKLVVLAVAAALSGGALAQAASLPAENLRDAVRKAVIGNPEVQASWHAFTASAEEQEVARGGYRPSVDVVGVVGREHLRDNGQNSTFSQRDATLRLSQILFFF